VIALADSRLTDADLARVCRALAPLLCLDADLRSSGCEPRVPGETAAKQTPVEHAIDRGTLAAARAAHARLDRCRGHVETLRWLAARGGELATVAGLAQMLAEERGPVPMREALPAAAAAARKAETALRHAQQRALPGKAAPTVEWLTRGGAEVSRARIAVESARARETGARSALVAWGRARIEAAVAVWHEAGQVVRATSD